MGVEPGDAYLFDADGTNQPHLWIVLAIYADEFAVAAHLTTLTERTQRDHRVCIVGPNDPDTYQAFVRVPSYVLYAQVRDFELGKLGAMPRHGAIPQALLARIRKGLHASSLTRKRFKGIVPRE